MKSMVYSTYTSTSTHISEATIKQEIIQRYKNVQSTLLPRVKIHRHAYILDIGCGWGGDMQAFIQSGFNHVYGCDISEEQIAYAHKLGLKTAVQEDALSYIQNRDMHFDVVCLFDFLEHVEINYAIRLLQAIYAKLRPNGYICARSPNGNCPLQTYTYSDVTHMRAFTPQSFRQLFLMAGIAHTSCYDCIYPASTFHVFIAQYIYRFVLKYIFAFISIALVSSTLEYIFTPNCICIAQKV